MEKNAMSDPNPFEKVPRFRWVILAIVMFSGLVVAFVYSALPPVMPLVINDLQITYAEAGLLVTAVGIPMIIISLPIGITADRYGAKLFGMVMLLCTLGGTFLVAMSSSFILVLLGRLISGIGYAMLSVILTMIVTQWFPPKELGLAMGLYMVSTTGSMVLAYSTLSNLGIDYGWRYVFYIGGIMAIFAIIAFILVIKEGPLLRAKSTSEVLAANKSLQWKTIKSAIFNFEIWKVGICWSLLQSGTVITFMTWEPTFLVNYQGMSLAEASIITSIFMMMTIPFLPIFGRISDRVGKRKIFLVISCALCAVMLFIIPLASGILLILLVVIYGIVGSPPPSIGLALTGELSGPGLSGIGFGVLNVFTGLSMAAMPLLVGWIQDTSGSMWISFAMMATFNIVAAIVAAFLKSK
jgi:MFS family permease